MIEIQKLNKIFYPDTHVLKDVDLTIRDGEIFGIIGMSGAGKSTLVRCINMLERPTSGSVTVNGVQMETLTPKQLRRQRRKITMIFQGFNLLMQRNCLSNVCFPLRLAGMKKSEAVERGMELLKLVGLPDKAKAYPSMLSGGQQQRIAIARALATDPEVLLCDEATSALDPKTTHAVLDLIRDINRKLGITVVIITHQMSVVEAICDRVAILDKGYIVEQGVVADVFSAPISEAARRLVNPELDSIEMVQRDGERVLRVIFNNSECAGAPIITQMAIDEHIAANILYASTRCIGDRVYGTMLLGFPNDDAIVERALQYLTHQTEGVFVEEVTENV